MQRFKKGLSWVKYSSKLVLKGCSKRWWIEKKKQLAYYMESQKFSVMPDSVSNNIWDQSVIKCFCVSTRMFGKHKSISSGRCFYFPLSEKTVNMLRAACAINLCFHAAVLFISGVPMVTGFMLLVCASFLQTAHLQVKVWGDCNGEEKTEEAEVRLTRSIWSTVSNYTNTYQAW